MALCIYKPAGLRRNKSSRADQRFAPCPRSNDLCAPLAELADSDLRLWLCMISIKCSADAKVATNHPDQVRENLWQSMQKIREEWWSRDGGLSGWSRVVRVRISRQGFF